MPNSDKIIKEALLCQPDTGFQVSGVGVSKIAGRHKSFIVSGFLVSRRQASYLYELAALNYERIA